jgi:hypothetical protein
MPVISGYRIPLIQNPHEQLHIRKSADIPIVVTLSSANRNNLMTIGTSAGGHGPHPAPRAAFSALSRLNHRCFTFPGRVRAQHMGIIFNYFQYNVVFIDKPEITVYGRTKSADLQGDDITS